MNANDLPGKAAEIYKKIRRKHKVAFETLKLNDKEIKILQVTDLESLLAGKDPFKDVSEFPFWVRLWEASLILSHVVAALPPGNGTKFLELGAGLGAPGLTAAACGYDVTLSDYEKHILDFQRVSAAANGFDNVDFKKGYLEDIPLPEHFADLVTSNCVINLSPDKKQVFVEIWRILRDHGRVVVSDTISEKPVPKGMRANPRLWGECVSGALTEAEYLSKMEQAGFYGLSILKRTLWREVEGYKFFSIVVRGYKFEKKSSCTYVGQYATYLGPMQAVVDEEGHLFPRDQAVAVCTDTAAKLQKPPYQSSFVVSTGTDMNEQSITTEEDTCPVEGECC